MVYTDLDDWHTHLQQPLLPPYSYSSFSPAHSTCALSNGIYTWIIFIFKNSLRTTKLYSSHFFCFANSPSFDEPHISLADFSQVAVLQVKAIDPWQGWGMFHLSAHYHYVLSSTQVWPCVHASLHQSQASIKGTICSQNSCQNTEPHQYKDPQMGTSKSHTEWKACCTTVGPQ